MADRTRNHDRVNRRATQTLRGAQRQFQNTIDEKTPPRVQMLTRFILNHLYDPRLNASYVEANCPAHGQVALQRFKLTHGYTLYRFIEACRLEAARRLLELEMELNASTVAALVGYSRYRTFARAFKRTLDRTPSEYSSNLDAASASPSLLPVSPA